MKKLLMLLPLMLVVTSFAVDKGLVTGPRTLERLEAQSLQTSCITPEVVRPILVMPSAKVADRGPCCVVCGAGGGWWYCIEQCGPLCPYAAPKRDRTELTERLK